MVENFTLSIIKTYIDKEDMRQQQHMQSSVRIFDVCGAAAKAPQTNHGEWSSKKHVCYTDAHL